MNYGFLYPGSTADLTVSLKNRGFSDFTDLNTILECDDPYISVLDNSGYFGSLAPESTTENISDRFVISVDPATPPQYVALLRVIATEGVYSDTFVFRFVTDTLHYCVWDPVLNSHSGYRIHSLLTALGFYGAYVPDFINNLGNCRSVFVCTGICSTSYYMPQWNVEAITLAEYLQEGRGCMYMEGDIWTDYWPYEYDFGPLFGIEDAGGALYMEVPVVGIPGTFTEGMIFDLSQYYTADIEPAGSGYLVFRREYGSWNCGIANITPAYRTIGATFEFGNLIDSNGVSTRSMLLDSIMSFFTVTPGVQEYAPACRSRLSLHTFPNPCSDALHIEYGIPPATNASLRIFDISGRMVYSEKIPRKVTNSLTWHLHDQDGNRVPNGIYFVSLNTGDHALMEKVILLK